MGGAAMSIRLKPGYSEPSRAASADLPTQDEAMLPAPTVPKAEVLSRELLQANALASIISRGAPTLQLLTEDEQLASISSMMAKRPAGDIWVFAYGSLIWNPIFSHLEVRRARILGWHRAFCLVTVSGRGTPENPGLVLGLDRGGACDGLALRMSEHGLEDELRLLWRREMVTRAYIPQWMPLFDEHGDRFGTGIAFSMDHTAPNYAGGLSDEARIKSLATAQGALGSSAEYLFRTHQSLVDLGIKDDDLARLAQQVRAARLLADSKNQIATPTLQRN
jgi:cation transport protein ChaC